MALKDKADHLAAGVCRMGPLPDGVSVDQDAPAVGVFESSDQRQQRALAGARAARDQNRLTSLDAKRQASQSADLSERLGDAIYNHLGPGRLTHRTTCTA